MSQAYLHLVEYGSGAMSPVYLHLATKPFRYWRHTTRQDILTSAVTLTAVAVIVGAGIVLGVGHNGITPLKSGAIMLTGSAVLVAARYMSIPSIGKLTRYTRHLEKDEFIVFRGSLGVLLYVKLEARCLRPAFENYHTFASDPEYKEVQLRELQKRAEISKD